MPKYLDRVKRQTAREDSPKRALVIGPPKVGKTLFASSWPEIFFIDTDRGQETLHSRGIFRPALQYGIKDVLAGAQVYEELMDFFQDIATGRNGWGKDGEWKDIKTIGLDSISTLAEVFLWDYMFNEHGKKRPDQHKPEFEDYGAVRNRLDTLMRIAVDIPLNLVVTSGVKSDEDDVSGVKNAWMPDIIGSYRSKAGHAFDTVIFMVKEDKGRSVAYNGYTNTTKGVSGARTEGTPVVVENPTYQKIFFPREGDLPSAPPAPGAAAARISRVS